MAFQGREDTGKKMGRYEESWQTDRKQAAGGVQSKGNKVLRKKMQTDKNGLN